jgi:hypothetical protein
MTRFDKIPAVTEGPEAGVPAICVASPIMGTELHMNVEFCCRDMAVSGAFYSHYTLNQDTNS